MASKKTAMAPMNADPDADPVKLERGEIADPAAYEAAKAAGTITELPETTRGGKLTQAWTDDATGRTYMPGEKVEGDDE